MKKKFSTVFLVCLFAVSMAACGSEANNTVLPPTEAVEATTTPTVQPTATEAPTPEPTVTEAPEPTQAEIPVVKDTYEYGVVTDIGYANKWCNLRFTTQPGFEFGIQDGLEMYAQCADGARVEISTVLLPEEYLELSEEYYIAMLVDELKKETGNSVEERGSSLFSLNGDKYTTATFMIEDADGRKRVDYFVRKKEARMIMIKATSPMAKSAFKSTQNILSCIVGYDSNPVYLPEEWLACSAFEAGTITENGYENEWLDMRIMLPEGATLKKTDMDMLDTIKTEIIWETKFPYVQFIIDFANGATAEDYLKYISEGLKTEASTLSEEGITFSADEQFKTELLGGQEYLVMSAISGAPEWADRYSDFYCRVQDNYLICFQFLYEKDSEEKIKEAMSLVTTY